MSLGWEFERVGKHGGASGAAYRNPLEGVALNREAKLAREAIQNSCDAVDHHAAEAVRVVFKKITLKGAEKVRFCRQFGLGEFGTRLDQLRLSQAAALSHINDEANPLRMLLIEDFNTTGLRGDVEAPDSDFFKFVYTIGDDDKAYDSAVSGGSFGFGKSVFANLSDSYTFLVHTVTDPSPNADGAYARFLGASFFSKHRYNNDTWTGRAWYGKSAGNGVVVPASDWEALDMAGAAYCAARSPEMRGTSVVIVGFDADMQLLRRGVEDYWWPRLEEHDVTVELWDGDQRLDPPRPKRRADLRPFIDCYAMALRRAEPSSQSESRGDLNRHMNRQLVGHLT